ncbi:MAG: hypothetical protein ACR2O1_00415 [Boseongicola sp.]
MSRVLLRDEGVLCTLGLVGGSTAAMGWGQTMDVSRNFLITGTVFLAIGLLIGMYMGGSGDHSLALGHAHINLIGFVLSAIFALTYRSYANMEASRLATYHFWLHLAGAVVVNVMLVMMLSGRITEAAMAPIAPLAELAIVIGVLLFLFNAWKNAR